MSKKNKKRSPRNRKRQKKAVSILASATASLPLLGLSTPVFAQHPPTSNTLGVQYSYFQDWQEGGHNRMKIHAPMAWIDAKIAENTQLETSFVLDSMSGASPFYHDTLSGASGIGIDDTRYAGDLTVTQYIDDVSVSAGGSYSTEEDYDSIGGSISTRYWSPDKNTVLLVGMNTNHNSISSTNNPLLDETMKDYGAIVGVTQILDRESLVQSNVSLEIQDGYLDDPYKLGDNRPSSRDRFAWLTRYVKYIESSDAALHFDYRFYTDSWHLLSHTFDFNWYQPVGEDGSWIIRPHVRYYSQRKADFYNDLEPVDVADDVFYSADQRLSSFGSLTFGLGLSHDLGDGYLISASYDFVLTKSGWALTNGSPDIDDLYLSYFSISAEKQF